jgi:uncharacterized protein YndB with AHSA1/START domain
MIRVVLPAHLHREEFVISRVVDAARDLVWKAWTEPERLKRLAKA